jgi:predicted DCC family thiol-disulfide oxidoreductase YuxK
MRPDRPVLFYDQDCRFCRASAQAVAFLDRDRRFAMLPFSDPLADDLLTPVAPDDRPNSIHVAQPDGWVVSGGEALAELTRAVPGGDCLADAAWKNEPLHRLFDWGYRLVADRRGTLSRFVPDYEPPLRPPEAT